MRYLRYAFLAMLGIVLISISLANREPVTLRLAPEEMAGLLGLEWAISLPLFVVVLGGVVAGLVIGFVWEWLREYKHRRDASIRSREVERLEREVTRLRGERNRGKDEVLAILDEAS